VVKIELKKELLFQATDNRFKCTECSRTIKKGEKYFRRKQTAWRSSHTVNMCVDCIIDMFFGLNLTKQEIVNHQKERMINKLGTK